MSESVERDERHKARMQRKKAVVEEKIAQAGDERGLLLVHTGNGKGKSSSAFGMAARALGHGMKVGVATAPCGVVNVPTRPRVARSSCSTVHVNPGVMRSGRDTARQAALPSAARAGARGGTAASPVPAPRRRRSSRRWVPRSRCAPRR